MKATIDVPDDLYRLVKAKSALEGRPVRDVAIELFRSYVGERSPSHESQRTAAQEAARRLGEKDVPPWFGVLEEYARDVDRHDMEAVRASVARGVASERSL